MIIIRLICFLTICCSLVYGKCAFHSDARTQALAEKLKTWNVYQNFTVSDKGSTYLIGLCVQLNSGSGAIIEQRNNSSHILGSFESISLVGDDNWMLLTYGQGEKYNNKCDNASRTASIMFVCGSNKNNLTVVYADTDDDPQCTYMFKLQVPQLCPTVEKTNKKLSGGAIFLIIIFSLATVYLVVGGIYMHVKRGARGLNRIPHFEMWRRLGNLAADGCDFCCRCERPMSRAGYFLDESGPDMHGGDDDILSP